MRASPARCGAEARHTLRAAKRTSGFPAGFQNGPADLKTASTDPATQAAIDALVAQLKGNDDAIADAVTANTPAAPRCLDGFTIQRAPDLAAP